MSRGFLNSEPTTGAATPRRAAEGRPSIRLGQHLRRLREGYGYTLRKVEEKAQSIGEAIDNSQLSRFEKGKALPSFDKLRALARIFNVPVQHFSDVIDLEEFEHLRPETDDYDALLAIGADRFGRGEPGQAFVAFEKAVEIAAAEPASRDGRTDRIAEARWRLGAALKALGKLSMSEMEFREILKLPQGRDRRIQLRAIFQLGSVYRERGEAYMARLLIREALDLALEDGDTGAQAAALNALGNVSEEEEPGKAIDLYRHALELLRASAGAPELVLMVTTNLGGCLVKEHRFAEGMALLHEAHESARASGSRRVAALSATRMAEGHFQRGDARRAERALLESDALAAGHGDPYNDILFLNSFHRWQAARLEGNPTREKIAFGRLRHLRSLIERKFVEVDTFDQWIGRHRRISS